MQQNISVDMVLSVLAVDVVLVVDIVLTVDIVLNIIQTLLQLRDKKQVGYIEYCLYICHLAMIVIAYSIPFDSIFVGPFAFVTKSRALIKPKSKSIWVYFPHIVTRVNWVINP